jgi:hypothetical protein
MTQVHRHFPILAEVNEWMATHFLDKANPSPVIDQLKAATADADYRFQANAPSLVASGLGDWAALDIPDPDRSGIRGAVRQIIAAESVGILPLCHHTEQIRPLMLFCDPPVIICAKCLPSRTALIQALGHRWNHQCDRCGIHTEMLTPIVIGGLGHITVSGHICDRCVAEGKQRAVEGAEQVVVIDRAARRRAQRSQKKRGRNHAL